MSAEAGSRDELLGIAVARGCDHYAAWIAPRLAVDRPDLRHEALGCALVRGPADLETFQAIRVGAMVLSDHRCEPAVVVFEATSRGVGARVAQIARIASDHDPERRDYWQRLLCELPESDPAEAAFLPTLSRYSAETGKIGLGRGAARVWLRTAYRP